MTAFWLFTQCIIIGLYRRFGKTCRLHLQSGQIYSKTITVAFVNINVNTSISFYQRMHFIVIKILHKQSLM